MVAARSRSRSDLGRPSRDCTGSEVRLFMVGPSKTNPCGMECQRKLRCTCNLGDDLFMVTRVCPVHALQRTLRRQEAAGFTSKHSIRVRQRRLGTFSGQGQKDSSQKAWAPGSSPSTPCEEWVHSSTHAEGVTLSFVQVLSRCGSATIERYVANAVEEKASWAPLAVRARLGRFRHAGVHGHPVELARQSTPCPVG